MERCPVFLNLLHMVELFAVVGKRLIVKVEMHKWQNEDASTLTNTICPKIMSIC
jgi:hypothetical protein